MPTIHRDRGFRFYFYSHEPNEPPHVHVDKGGASAKVWLQPIALASNHGYSSKDLSRILQIIRAQQFTMIREWHDFFDTDR